MALQHIRENSEVKIVHVRHLRSLGFPLPAHCRTVLLHTVVENCTNMWACIAALKYRQIAFKISSRSHQHSNFREYVFLKQIFQGELWFVLCSRICYYHSSSHHVRISFIAHDFTIVLDASLSVTSKILTVFFATHAPCTR